MSLVGRTAKTRAGRVMRSHVQKFSVYCTPQMTLQLRSRCLKVTVASTCIFFPLNNNSLHDLHYYINQNHDGDLICNSFHQILYATNILSTETQWRVRSLRKRATQNHNSIQPTKTIFIAISDVAEKWDSGCGVICCLGCNTENQKTQTKNT